MAPETDFTPEFRAAVETQLSRMCSIPLFRRKPRVRSFLEYTVRQTLDQQHAKLKEYSIAVEVFGRPEGFDPRLDSIVRVEARRLRATVELYYDNEGRGDSLVIRYRRGNYVPSFETRDGNEDTRPVSRFTGVFSQAGGELLIGVLGGVRDYDELAAEKSSASLTILRTPLAADTLQQLRSGDSQLVLLRPATVADIDQLLDGEGPPK